MLYYFFFIQTFPTYVGETLLSGPRRHFLALSSASPPPPPPSLPWGYMKLTRWLFILTFGLATIGCIVLSHKQFKSHQPLFDIFDISLYVSLSPHLSLSSLSLLSSLSSFSPPLPLSSLPPPIHPPSHPPPHPLSDPPRAESQGEGRLTYLSSSAQYVWCLRGNFEVARTRDGLFFPVLGRLRNLLFWSPRNIRGDI